MMRLLQRFLVLVVVIASSFLLITAAYANNMDVANVSLTDRDSTANTIKVQFDIYWENSWNQQANYDAAWVFIKYSTDSGTTWNHATLKTSGTDPTGFSTGTAQGSSRSISIIVPSDKVGAFIKPGTGHGDMNVDDIQFVWDYGTDGVSDSDTVRVQVHAIEMVYIPTANFYIGDGNGSSESDSAFHTGTNNSAVQVTSSLLGDVRVDTGGNDDTQLTNTGIGIDGDGGLDTDDNGSVDNANFPTGYSAFYLMKYEMSEGQWVEFFNTLTSAQKTNRDITSGGSCCSNGKASDSWVDRNTISWSSGDATTDRADRAMTNLSWMDDCAYADWSGLRPMTELEYEKAARGPKSANYGEFAWGTTDITQMQAITAGTEDGTETVSTKNANAVYSNNTFANGVGDCDGTTAKCEGPVRVGIFADQSPNREKAGAGYYGNMELSGNAWEPVVSVGSSTGRSFEGTHGDGVLTTTTNYEGFATNTDWPGIGSTTTRGVVGATGSGLRGGGFAGTETEAKLSERDQAAYPVVLRQSASFKRGQGFRGARTAP